MSLVKCFNLAKIPREERAEINASISSLTEFGMSEKKATLKVVKDLLKEAESERSNIIEFIRQNQPKEAPKETPGEIEDVGEKLGGARKDLAQQIKSTVADDEIGSHSLSEIWPKPKVEDLDNSFVSAFVVSARAEIPNKPRVKYKLTRWVEKVQLLRGLSEKLLSREISEETIIEKIKGYPTLRGFTEKVEILQKIDKTLWSEAKRIYSAPDAYSYDKDGKKVSNPYLSVNGRTYTYKESIDEAIPAIEKDLKESIGKPKGKMRFEVRGTERSGYFINKTGDPEYRHLKEFSTSKEALEYRMAHTDDLIEEWEKVKARDNIHKTDVRNKINRARTGKDHRKGKDVGAEEFRTAFGFRGVEFGLWVKQGKNAKDRQGMVNAAYDALLDLSAILDVPPKAISLNGQLGLGFGSRGHGAASAHFEPDTFIINLTKPSGAGSLAHEWFHALDNYFQRKRGVGQGREKNFITYRPETIYRNKNTGAEVAANRFKFVRDNRDDWEKVPGVRPEVETQFVKLVEVLNESEMYKRSRKIDKGKSGYWSRIIERAARSFENYIIGEMATAGYNNDYLANVTKIDEFKKNLERYPYLTEEELIPVKKAFDNLFKTIETRETDKGIELYSTKTTFKDSNISLKDVQSLFKGQKVGIAPDGTIFVKTKLGKGVQIKSVETISPDNAAFKVAYGRAKGSGELIAGKYKDGVITISKVGDIWTVAHEGHGHWAEEMGFINKNDQKALTGEIKRRIRKGTWKTLNKDDIGGKEDRAEFIAQELKKRTDSRPTVQRILQKIQDLIDAFVNLYKRTARGVVKDVRSGKIYDKEQKALREGMPMFATKGALSSVGVEIDKDGMATVYRGGDVSATKLKKIRYGDYLSAVKEGKDLTGNSGAAEYGKNVVTLKIPAKDLKITNGELQYVGKSESLKGGKKYPVAIYKAYNDVYGSNYTAQEIDEQDNVWSVAPQGLYGGKEEYDKLLSDFRGKAEQYSVKKPDLDPDIKDLLNRYMPEAKKGLKKLKDPSHKKIHRESKGLFKYAEDRFGKKFIDKDMKWYDRTFNNPYWSGKKFWFMKDAVGVEINAAETRSTELFNDYDGDLGDLQDGFRKWSKAQKKEFNDLIWKWDGVRMPKKAVPTDWHKTIEQGEDIEINPEHYKEVQAFLEKQGINPAVIQGFITIRKKLDEKYVDIDSTMRIEGLDPSKIREYRADIKKVNNYFPHRRTGNAYIQIFNKEKGNVVFREHYSVFKDRWFSVGKKATARAEKWLKEAIKDGRLKGSVSDYRVGKPGPMKEMPDEVFFQIPMEAIQQVVATAGKDLATSRVQYEADRLYNKEGKTRKEALALAKKRLTADMEDALSKAVADTFKARGWGKHGIHRKNIPGHETEDVFGILFDYLSGYSGFKTKITRTKALHEILINLDAKKYPAGYKHLSKYVKDMLANQDKTDRAVDTLRGIFFVKYLGFVVKSGMVNLTQNVVMAAPMLGLHTKEAHRKLSKAMIDVRKALTSKNAWFGKEVEYKHLTRGEQQALHDMVESGATMDLFLRELKGNMPGVGIGKHFKKVIDKSGVFMQVAEKFNRASTGLAAYRVGIKEKGMSHDEAVDLAKQVVYDSHFLYGKANMPSGMRGGDFQKIARAGYTFRSFSHNYILAMKHLFFNQPGGKKAFARSLRNIFLMGGLTSIPFFKVLSNALLWAIGEDDEDALTMARKVMPNEWTKDLIVYGLPGVLGADFSGSLSIEVPRNYKDIIGVPYAAIEDSVNMYKSLKSGNLYRAASETPITPISVRNAMRGLELYTVGHRTRSGRDINAAGKVGPRKITTKEFVQKSFVGLQPTSVSKGFASYRATKKMQTSISEKRRSFADRFVNALRRDDQKAIEAIMQEIVKWNEKAAKARRPHRIIDIEGMIESRMKPGFNNIPENQRWKALEIQKQWE